MSETSAAHSNVSSRLVKKRAKVWEHIETEIIDGKEHSSCKYCKTKLSTEPGKGTNHLNRHIALYCHNIPAEDRDRFLLTWKPHNSAVVPHVFEPHVFRLLIAKFFVSAEIAFRKADGPHWKNMINYCQPSFRVVGRQTTGSDCIELYEEEKKQLQIFVEKQASHVNLTADLWTSNQNLGYICVTAHFIDDQFELRKMIVAFKNIAFPHTSYAVQDGITSCLLDWDLTSKLFTLTLDNASVNDRAAKDLRAALGAEIFFKGEHLHVRCAAHVLNIIVQDGLKLIPYAFVQPDEQHMSASESSSSSPGVARFGKRRIELAFAQFTSNDAGANAQLSELDAYLKEPRVYANPEEHFDLLGWWKRNAEIFPTLSLMARDFLAIPVSTVSSESAFSCAGRLLGKDRTSLTPESLEALICCKDWIVGFSDEDEGQCLMGYRTCDMEEYT